MNATTEARQLAQILIKRGLRIVFAESCTAGMVSGLLAAIPGISEHLCGSMVTYRAECKQDWLAIPAETLQQHSAVSSIVTRQMSIEVLQRTPIADLSAAVTGHLGPYAPASLDGRYYVAMARRQAGRVEVAHQAEFQLLANERTARQLEAARKVLSCVADLLEGEDSLGNATSLK